MYHALNVLIRLNGDTGQQGTLAQAFSDHPDTQKRATHIKEMAEAAGYKLTTTGSSSNISTGSSNINISTGSNSGSNNGSNNGSGNKKTIGVKVGGGK